MKAKKTFYKNFYFRSKLEAKWAVFFNLCGIEWDYEPEAFTDKSGVQYTPDFYLPNVTLRGQSKGVYLEIKPYDYETNERYQRIIYEAMDGKSLILLCGDPVRAIIDIDKYDPIITNKNEQISPFWDNEMVFMLCSDCGKSKFEFNEGNYYYCNICGGRISRELTHENAIKARNFRFEFYSTENTPKSWH